MASLELTDEQTTVLHRARSIRRDLPWRRTRDPWRVLVAEVMLQQTQVDRVIPKWIAFLDRWPDVRSCAEASLSAVLDAWSGLGYPRRARNLQAAARVIAFDHGGRFPDDLEGLLALPGIGPYTARAVLAFAFERDVAVVDTNVGRVLARRAGVSLRQRDAQDLADDWVPDHLGWEWNQGLLDLGALRCRPLEPVCVRCPVAATCIWHLAGHPLPDPATGSAAVSRRQARFEGSARQARGRLLRAASAAPVPDDEVAVAVQWHERTDAAAAARAVVESLLIDGLLARDDDGHLVLPQD